MRFYPDELKDEAIRLVVKHRLTSGQAAIRLGLRAEVVRIWVRRFRYDKARPSEVDRMGARVKTLTSERETLVNIIDRLLGIAS